ncbi:MULTISPECIES: hypothetical protein [unclassified Streptomyces]
MSEQGAAPPAVDAYPETLLRRIGRLGDVSGRSLGAPADRPTS